MGKIDKLIKHAQPHLEEGENILASIMGVYETRIMKNDTVRNGIFLATNKRLIFYAKKLTGYDLEVFPYRNISSIEMGKDYMGERISFFTSGNRVCMKWINTGDVAKFIQVINQGINGTIPTSDKTETPVMTAPEDDVDMSATSSNSEISALNQDKIPFWRKIPGYRTGTKWKMAVASVFYFLFLCGLMGAIFGEEAPEQAEKLPAVKSASSVQKSPAIKNYSLEFAPKIKHTCKDGKITIDADINCPDGALMQVVIMSGDLKEMYTDKPIVKNGKISSVFNLENIDTKNYAGMVMFQFNAKDLPQPDNVLKIYGKHGEKLKGDNAQEAKFADGNTGKNASVSFTVPYPSEQAVEQVMATKFNEVAKEIAKASNGVILDIERDSPGIYHIMVSNSSWYLSAQNEKQYFAEEMLRTFKQIGKSLDGGENVVLSIYDESMNEVASSKMFGGMKIKK